MMSIEQQTVMGRRLGFVIVFSRKNATRPYIRYLDGNGDLSRHGREPTECELRMWYMLIGRPYDPWSLSPGTGTQSALERLGVGMPLDSPVVEDSGSSETPGDSGS